MEVNLMKKLLAVVSFAALVGGAAAAEDTYPSRRISIIVPAPPAGVADVLMRALAAESAKWAQPIVVENRPGGDMVIGTGAVLAAPADGYTWLNMIPPTYYTNPLTRKNPAWDPINDFVVMGKLATSPNVLTVRSDLPIQTVREFIERARAQPGKLSAGMNSVSSNYLHLDTLAQSSGINVLAVPYLGTTQIAQSLASQSVDVAFLPLSVVAPLITSGRLRGLAITSDKRSSVLPDVPTMTESGFAELRPPWFGVAVKRGVPHGVLQRIHEGINSAISSALIQGTLVKLGSEAIHPQTLQSLESLNDSEMKYYSGVIRRATSSLKSDGN